MNSCQLHGLMFQIWENIIQWSKLQFTKTCATYTHILIYIHTHAYNYLGIYIHVLICMHLRRGLKNTPVREKTEASGPSRKDLCQKARGSYLSSSVSCPLIKRLKTHVPNWREGRPLEGRWGSLAHNHYPKTKAGSHALQVPGERVFTKKHTAGCSPGEASLLTGVRADLAQEKYRLGMAGFAGGRHVLQLYLMFNLASCITGGLTVVIMGWMRSSQWDIWGVCQALEFYQGRTQPRDGLKLGD